MPDPISIAATAGTIAKTAKAAWDIGEALYSFVQDARVVDEAIRALQAEVKSFGDACDLLQSVLRGLTDADKAKIEEQDGEFCLKLESAIEEYGSTVSELGEALRGMEGRSTSVFRKGLKQVKLNMKKDEIDSIRRRIASHVSCVQMSLATLNFKVSLLATRIVDPQILLEEIRNLQDQRARVETTQFEVKQEPGPTHDEPILPNRPPPVPPQAAAKERRNYPNNKFGETIHVPPLDPVNAAQWSTLSLHEDGQNGALIGAMVESIFETPDQIYDILCAIWTLLEREQGDELDQTDFVLAMHLLTCIKTGAMTSLPLGIPPDLYRAAIEAGQASPKVELITASLTAAQPTVPASGRNAKTTQASRPSESTTALMRAADEVLEIATTIYEGSVAGGSVVGGPSKAYHVADWLQTLNDIDEDAPASPASTKRTREPSIFSQSSSGQTPLTEYTNHTHPFEALRSSRNIEGYFPEQCDDEEDSDDDDIEAELAKKALDAGHRALKDGQHRAAKDAFLESIALVQQLSTKRRASVCSVWELRYNLAVCSFYLDERAQAEAILQEVLQQAPSSDSQRQNLLHISHLLAQLYVQAGNLDQALHSCQKTLKGRRRLFGKDHQSCYVSLALMHKIYLLQKLPLRAQGYLDLIPEGQRESYSRMFHGLDPHSTNPFSRMSTTPTFDNRPSAPVPSKNPFSKSAPTPTSDMAPGPSRNPFSNSASTPTSGERLSQGAQTTPQSTTRVTTTKATNSTAVAPVTSSDGLTYGRMLYTCLYTELFAAGEEVVLVDYAENRKWWKVRRLNRTEESVVPSSAVKIISRLVNTASGAPAEPSTPIMSQVNREALLAGHARSPWAMTDDRKKLYVDMFKTWDSTERGYINISEAVDILGQTGLPQSDLDRIWRLTDPGNKGQLRLGDFAVAMHLIYKCLDGYPIPNQLPPELVPRDSPGTTPHVLSQIPQVYEAPRGSEPQGADQQSDLHANLARVTVQAFSTTREATGSNGGVTLDSAPITSNAIPASVRTPRDIMMARRAREAQRQEEQHGSVATTAPCASIANAQAEVSGGNAPKKGRITQDCNPRGSDETIPAGEQVEILHKSANTGWTTIRRLTNGKEYTIAASHVREIGLLRKALAGLNKTPLTPNQAKVRTWNDRSGVFKVEAEYIGLREEKIHLHKVNGVKIAVPIKMMAIEDLEYVERETGASLEKYKPVANRYAEQVNHGIWKFSS